MTYDPTAKAEALSRLLRTLRQEADPVEYLENVLVEWREKALGYVETNDPEAWPYPIIPNTFAETLGAVLQGREEPLEKIAPDESATESGQRPRGAGETAPAPFLTPERRAAVEALINQKGQAKEPRTGDPLSPS